MVYTTIDKQIMKISSKINKPEDPLYDLSLIDKMCRGNQEQVVKMVQVFIIQTSESIEELKLAETKKNTSQIKTLVHKIKPSFTYYGTVKLEREAKLIEALFLEEFEISELELKIERLAELATQVINKMKNDFSITKNKNYE